MDGSSIRWAPVESVVPWRIYTAVISFSLVGWVMDALEKLQ